MTDLPTTVTSLIEAVNAHDTARVLTVFASDAVVVDDGRTFRGHDEIRKWSDKENVAVSVVLTPTGSAVVEGETVVDMRADGDFEGSPLPFVFRFRPADPDFTQIAELTIVFAG